MNRKDRRAAEHANRGGAHPRPAAAPSPNVETLFAVAVGYHKGGQLAAAENAYRDILAIAPDHVRTLHFLGVLAHQLGRSEAAAGLIASAIARDDRVPEFHYNLGVVYEALKRMDEAAAHYRNTVSLKPDHANACLNLGNVLLAQGKLEEAEVACRRAVALNSRSPDAPFNLGLVLLRRHRYGDAIEKFRDTLRLNPNHAAAHSNLGVAYSASGENEKAAHHCRQCLALDPRDHQAAIHLGLSCLALGDFGEALELGLHALDIADTPPARYLFTRAARQARATVEHAQFRENLRRALAGAWDRPSYLMGAALSVIKMNSGVRAALERQASALSRGVSVAAVDDAIDLVEIARDLLLRELMRTTPIFDIEVERMLTLSRHGMLDLAANERPPAVRDDVLQFYCALAQQCFCNEYVYAVTEQEQEHAKRLGDNLAFAVANGDDLSHLRIVAVSAYMPLHGLASSELLLNRIWPAPIAAVLRQQIEEPNAQLALRSSLPNLTTVEDSTSIDVKRQYEENPYPRWMRVGSSFPALPLDVYLAAKYRDVPYKPLGKDKVEILIAGCGTGHHAIEASLRFAGADVLAVDLSAASLGYALHKTRELGLTNIQYAVADILKLDTLGRYFDVIEANGVLHHLADPMAAWRSLLAILRPGGVMNIGLYSELARQGVVRARSFITERACPATADGIRRCRQEIVDADDPLLKAITESADFFTVSECRDLLFHVREHRMTLPQIAAFIEEAQVTFLGFDADTPLLKQYEARFPDDRSKTDLACWHQFEIENPRSFAGMYQFWIQKP